MSLKDSCSDCINHEFRVESLGLEHDEPRTFVQSQWPVRQRAYAIYRSLVAAGFIAWLISDVFTETRAFFKDHAYTYLIYATNWSFLLLTLTAIYTAVCTLVYSMKYKDRLDRHTFDAMPSALKLQWVLQNLSYNSAIVVTVSYWSYIAVLDRQEVMQTTSSQVKHTLNTVYVLVDIFVIGAPIRIFHFLYTVILGSVYSVFNAIYFLNDGTITEGRHYAYNLLDWSKPSAAVITCALCVVLCVFSQIILYELYRIRLCIFTKVYFGSDRTDKSDAEMQRIIGETNSPAYQTLSRDENESINQTGDDNGQ